MSKDSRSGGKYSGNHTTLVPAAAHVCDLVHKCPLVTRISPGFIKAGIGRGERRVKITKEKTCLLLAIRDGASHQEVYVYADDLQGAMLAIARAIRSVNIPIAFGKHH